MCARKGYAASVSQLRWQRLRYTRRGHAASVSQLTLATAALYFPFFKLKKWGKKTAEARRHNCAVLSYNVYPAKLRKLSLRAMAVRHLGQR